MRVILSDTAINIQLQRTEDEEVQGELLYACLDTVVESGIATPGQKTYARLLMRQMNEAAAASGGCFYGDI